MVSFETEHQEKTMCLLLEVMITSCCENKEHMSFDIFP